MQIPILKSAPRVKAPGRRAMSMGLVGLVKVGSKPILRNPDLSLVITARDLRDSAFGGRFFSCWQPKSIETTTGKSIKVLRQSVGASVWDDFFDSDGKAKTVSELHPPVTSNKVRGPLSGQAKKIGAHAYYLIDHVFFDPDFFELKAHCFEPKRFQSRISALEEVQPSLRNPSDHYPVIADLLLKSKQTAKFCRTCWDESDYQQNLAQSSHTRTLPKKPVQYHCSCKKYCAFFSGVKSWE